MKFCLPSQCVTSVGATNSSQINPISIPKDTTCAEQMESKQTTRTTPDKFAPTYPNSEEFLQPSSVVIQSPTQHHTRLFEPTASDVEHKKLNITPMDQQRNRQCNENGSQSVDIKIDAESGNGTHNTEEKSKEEVVILSTEKTSNFSKTAKISIVSDVVAGDTLNRYGNIFYRCLFSYFRFLNFVLFFNDRVFEKRIFLCVTFNYMLG